MDKGNITCNCFDKILDVILRAQQFENVITTDYKYEPVGTAKEKVAESGEALKKAIREAVDCGLPPTTDIYYPKMGIKGMPLEDIVDRTVKYAPEPQAMWMLWDAIWDNAPSTCKR